MNKKNEILNDLKIEYEGVEMSQNDLEKFKAKIQQAKFDNKKAKKRAITKSISAVAAAVALIITLANTSATAAYAMGNIPFLGNLIRAVTFREYVYEDEKNTADVKIPEVVVDSDKVVDENVKDTVLADTGIVNEQINELSEKWIAEFEKNKENEGFHDLQISSEIVKSTSSYFTIKISCYEASASGYEENHYYTIDLNTGKELTLAKLFADNDDYISQISEEIKKQMKAQMAKDENAMYFLETDIPEEDFKEISDSTQFYINKDGRLVITFNELEVAPAYMGCVEFVIDSMGEF